MPPSFCAAEDPAARELPARCEGTRRTVALRAVAGPLSGRVLPHRRSPAVPDDRCSLALDLPGGRSARLSLCWRDGRLWGEAEDLPERYPLRVNGYAIGQALALQPGDQLGVATHRFVVDASCAPADESGQELAPQSAPEEAAGPPGEVWWLIVTAALLALAIAVVLLVRF